MGSPAIRSLSALIGLGLAALVASGCGVNPDQASETAGQTGPDARFVAPVVKSSRPDAVRTSRQEGTIRIAGKAQGSMTERMVRSFRGVGPAIEFEQIGGNEERAFREFCAGNVDIVDAARPISEKEYRRCIKRGIQPVQFQVASDAAVLAIKNTTDVGVDCLSLDEVYNIFRAGSPINSWSQVGFGRDMQTDTSAPRVKVAGPDERSNVFGFFGQYVLGDSEPSLLSVRSSYEAFPTDAGVRRAVVGNRRDYAAASRYERSNAVLEQIEGSLAENRQAVRDARAEVEKGIRDQRTPEAQARDQRLLRQAERNLRNLKASLPESRRYVKANRAAVRRIKEREGTLGLFRFSYYEAFEEQLRPMEVSASNNFNEPECVFPSQSTVTAATYPLSRQLLLTVNYRNMSDSDINDFLTNSLNRAQGLAEDVALVPIPDEIRDRERGWLNGTSEPDIVFYGDVGTNVAEESK